MLLIDDQHPATASKASIFLHGVTGAGKSTWATTGGRPLVILTEPKAMAILRQVNPQAQGFVPQGTEDILGLFQRLGQPDWLATKKIDRIVLDSFTDLTYSLPAWMKDPNQILLKMEIQEFGDLKNYALALVKAIQYTGYPSIIIARSTVKKVGRVEKVVPDGYGRSVEELPGKCLPTAEARYDSELGYLIDSTPDECSQRCGLPWIPPIWKGSAIEFLEAVERGTRPSAGQVLQEEQAHITESKPPVSQAASDFVDGVDPEPAKASSSITLAEFEALVQACKLHKVPLDKLEAYCLQNNRLIGATLSTLQRDNLKKITTAITDETKRRALLAHLSSLTIAA